MIVIAVRILFRSLDKKEAIKMVYDGLIKERLHGLVQIFKIQMNG